MKPEAQETFDHHQQQHGIGRFIGMIMGSSFFTFGLSVINETQVQQSAVGYSQMWMEGIDMLLPLPVGMAAAADKSGKKRLGIALRSVTNIAHVVASGAGAVEARNYLTNAPQPTWGNVAIAGMVGLINLGIFRTMRKNHAGHNHGPQAVEMTSVSIAEPETPVVVFDESRHHHPYDDSGRNIENLEVCVRSNIWEAGPGVTYPLWAALEAPGVAAASVIGANVAIAFMNGRQFVKDMQLLRTIHQPVE